MTDNLLVKHLGGSHAYGTSLPTSDVDYRGIFCADPVNVRTPFFPVREVEDTDEEDTKFYELAHFMKLCLDCNPNIVETLWVADEDITFRTDAYDMLRARRSELLSSKVAFTFSGYAQGQLSRIKNHNRWINWVEPIDKLCKLLAMAFKDGEIDKEFIEHQCGKEILYFMEQKHYFL